MESTDVIVVGAGLIGLALARELRRQGLQVRIFDSGKAGHGASWAGAGMIAGHRIAHPALRRLGIASGRLYETWAPELEREVGLPVSYRRCGTLFLTNAERPLPKTEAVSGWRICETDEIAEIEPELHLDNNGNSASVWRIQDDHCIDNRLLTQALGASVQKLGVELTEDTPVEAILAPGATEPAAPLTVVAGGRHHHARVVVNAAGAWAGAFAAPVAAPVRPRKGQMIGLRSNLDLHCVLEAPDVYLVPRAPGRVVVGATVEDVGFDPSVSNDTAQELRRRIARWVPKLAAAVIEETWIGYRPCSADDLPILGPTHCPGYWFAAAHFRDGILLAPITAKMIAKAIATGRLSTAIDWGPFLPGRFASTTLNADPTPVTDSSKTGTD